MARSLGPKGRDLGPKDRILGPKDHPRDHGPQMALKEKEPPRGQDLGLRGLEHPAGQSRTLVLKRKKKSILRKLKVLTKVVMTGQSTLRYAAAKKKKAAKAKVRAAVSSTLDPGQYPKTKKSLDREATAAAVAKALQGLRVPLDPTLKKRRQSQDREARADLDPHLKMSKVALKMITKTSNPQTSLSMSRHHLRTNR